VQQQAFFVTFLSIRCLSAITVMTLSLDISKENCKKTPFQQSSVTTWRTFWQAWIQDSSFRDQNQGGDL